MFKRFFSMFEMLFTAGESLCSAMAEISATLDDKAKNIRMTEQVEDAATHAQLKRSLASMAATPVPVLPAP